MARNTQINQFLALLQPYRGKFRLNVGIIETKNKHMTKVWGSGGRHTSEKKHHISLWNFMVRERAFRGSRSMRWAEWEARQLDLNLPEWLRDLALCAINKRESTPDEWTTLLYLRRRMLEVLGLEEDSTFWTQE